MSYYTLDEQTTLIGHGKRMLESAGSGPISAFRSGSFAANSDTFKALHRNHIFLDTSLNRCYDVSAPELRNTYSFNQAFETDGVTTFPVTVMKDGFGKDRHAQVGACSFGEMRDALKSAQRAGHRDFVVVSHNFEMLKPATSAPDWVVVKRFDQLCGFLASNTKIFSVRGFGADLMSPATVSHALSPPKATLLSTTRRYVEQLQRRLF